MNREEHQHLITVLNKSIEPLSKQKNYSSLLDAIGNARFVMIGEATHGTYEFYQTRIQITQQLIRQKDFMAVAIEGDWPDAYRVHRYLQGKAKTNDANTALMDFKRFPKWMWHNTTLPPFLSWLREYNDTLASAQKIGFYGLDLYSLNASMEAVVDFLLKVDKEAALAAKHRYACFNQVGVDPQTYAYLAKSQFKKSCANEVVAQLCDLQQHAFQYIQNDLSDEDAYFFALQNARVVKNAEFYYRSMFEGPTFTWNIRDAHMAETIQVLVDHLERRFNKPAKIIIWAHNSHVGDARATEMGEQGEVNIGQLVRERYRDVYSIGFSTYEGFVTAASDWDEPAKRKQIVPGFAESYEELFHQLRYKNFILYLQENEELNYLLKLPRLQRAIGVIYRPETERLSHYFFTHLPQQFDSIIHFDKTTAVEPIIKNSHWS